MDPQEIRGPQDLRATAGRVAVEVTPAAKVTVAPQAPPTL